MEKTPGTETALVITGGFCDIEKIKKTVPMNAGLIVAADSGLDTAVALGLKPDIIMGDFDSYTKRLPDDIPVYRVPCEKDDTDTMLACNYAVEKGFRNILIIGGTGGRIDHSIANIFFLEALKDRGISASLSDGGNTVMIIKNESVHIPNEGGFFSVFALDSCVVTEKGSKYELNEALLVRNNPLGVSNEVAGDEAVVTVDGTAVLVLSGR